MGNSCNCEADKSTCSAWGMSCSLGHCKSAAKRETQKSDEEQRREYELKLLELDRRCKRNAREYDENKFIDAHFAEHGKYPSIEQLNAKFKTPAMPTRRLEDELPEAPPMLIRQNGISLD